MSFLCKILSLFSNGDLYNIQYLDVNELNGQPEGIRDIYEGKLDGIVVRGFLSKKEIQGIKAKVDSIDAKLHMKVPYGSVIGFPLNAVKQDRSEYFA